MRCRALRNNSASVHQHSTKRKATRGLGPRVAGICPTYCWCTATDFRHRLW